MKKISIRRKTAGYIEEIELETSRRIILANGSKQLIIEPEDSDEQINSIIQDFESLEQSIETKKKPLLQRIKEILPLPKK